MAPITLHEDARGRLRALETAQVLPFPVARVYLLDRIAPGASRGHHAHRSCQQALLVVSGALTLHLDDGRHHVSRRLGPLGGAVLIDAGVWHWLDGFEPGTACLVLASHPHDEADYIRDRAAFEAWCRSRPVAP